MHSTILIVERDPALREALSEVLALAGFRPLTAVSQEEAASLLQGSKQPIDITLLGIPNTPQNDKNLLWNLSRLQPDMKVLVTSGYHEEVVRATVNVPPDTAVTYLRRPFTSASLLSHLQALSV